MNLLLFRLTGRPYDEALLTFLRLDEMLVDIGDDLFDYEDDVIANSFNILRGALSGDVVKILTFGWSPSTIL